MVVLTYALLSLISKIRSSKTTSIGMSRCLTSLSSTLSVKLLKRLLISCNSSSSLSLAYSTFSNGSSSLPSASSTPLHSLRNSSRPSQFGSTPSLFSLMLLYAKDHKPETQIRSGSSTRNSDRLCQRNVSEACSKRSTGGARNSFPLKGTIQYLYMLSLFIT
ncbi:hypothetical protein V6Z11_D10G077700 [Gossypium hirsutum]